MYSMVKRSSCSPLFFPLSELISLLGSLFVASVSLSLFFLCLKYPRRVQTHNKPCSSFSCLFSPAANLPCFQSWSAWVSISAGPFIAYRLAHMRQEYQSLLFRKKFYSWWWLFTFFQGSSLERCVASLDQRHRCQHYFGHWQPQLIRFAQTKRMYNLTCIRRQSVWWRITHHLFVNESQFA